MTTEQIPYGFRVLDDPTETRRPVNADDAFFAYADNDSKAETHRTGYLSAFQFADDFLEYRKVHGTTKGFDGLCGGRWLWIDIDRPNISDALTAARSLVESITNRYGLHGDELLLFFSGSKGFHIGIPLSLCGYPEPSREFNRVCRRFAEALAAQASVTIDSCVYDKVRLFRAPNSTHQKTRLRKQCLTFDELLNLNAERILELAREPLPFEVPDDPPVNETARQDWLNAVADLQKQTAAAAERRKRSSGTGRLNQATLIFIREGAEHGDRHRALFAAAANLGEFGCPPELAHALLKEAGLDSGLPPGDVRRQIDFGLAHTPQNAAGEDVSVAVALQSSTRCEAATGPPDAEDRVSLTAELSLLWQRDERGT